MAHVHFPGDEFTLFCKNFKGAIDKTKIGENDNDDKKRKKAKEILKACGKECSVGFANSTLWKKHAILLFLGVPESDFDTLTKEKYKNLMVLDGGFWTLHFFTFLLLASIKKS